MKKSICLIGCLLALTLTSTFSQQPVASGTVTFTPSNNQPSQTTLTKFNLDFPGGTPNELVAAIQKATGKPLNAIIPDEYANIKLPPLKLTEVDVSQLFQALQMASAKTEAYVTGASFGGVGGSSFGGVGGSSFGGGGGRMGSAYQFANTSYGFRTTGLVTDDTIWYFYVEKPNKPPTTSPEKATRFYALTPYLDRGLTVDDITTAIQTGWKMSGDRDTPTISFHKETKLLIAVGEPDKLQVIDDVLRALEPSQTVQGQGGRRIGAGGGGRGGGVSGGRSGAPITTTSPAAESNQ
jgi:hypothetical protein